VNTSNFYVCTLDYYRRAIDVIKKKVESPTFFVFSNDIEWVRENISIPGYDVFYESGNNPVWETFRLMYSCKHFIISNSTFHWWAQYCSRNTNKVVVCPDKWFSNPQWPSYLIEQSFITVRT